MREALLHLVRSGMLLTKACAQLGIDRANVYYTSSVDEEFSNALSEARVRGVDGLVDEAVEVAGDAINARTPTEVAGRKLYVGQLNWVAERLAPHRWGPKSSMQVNVTHQLGEADQAKRLRFLQELQAPTIDATATEVVEEDDGAPLA